MTRQLVQPESDDLDYFWLASPHFITIYASPAHLLLSSVNLSFLCMIPRHFDILCHVFPYAQQCVYLFYQDKINPIASMNELFRSFSNNSKQNIQLFHQHDVLLIRFRPFSCKKLAISRRSANCLPALQINSASTALLSISIYSTLNQLNTSWYIQIMSSGQYILYDIPSREPCSTWTPNPWKSESSATTLELLFSCAAIN